MPGSTKIDFKALITLLRLVIRFIRQLMLRTFRAPFCLAIFIVIAVNYGLITINPLGRFAPENLPATHSWIWWATQDFIQQKPSPAVVLLGSSLLVNPILEQEAKFQDQAIDSVIDHRLRYLQTELERKLTLKNLTCFNFAVPGSLMSDNYMIMRCLFDAQRKPKLVILGLALRDFIDNEVPSAASTPTYRYMSRFTDATDLESLTLPNIWQRCESFLSRHIYLIGRKLDIQAALSQKASHLADAWTRYFPNCQLNAFDLSCYIPSTRSEIERGVWITKPNEEKPYHDNSAEYRRRYKSPNLQFFDTQSIFLDKFCEAAIKLNIQVILVNMPVTPQHISLMPDFSYGRYLETLKKTARKYHFQLLDLNHSDIFRSTDFSDTCHMRGSGGKKLLDLIVDEVVTRPTL